LLSAHLNSVSRKRKRPTLKTRIRAALTKFLSLANSRIIWDLETQKQYTVESVVIASNREVQHFENDLDFNLTGYGSLRCEMLTQPTVTTGQVEEEARTLTAIAAGDCEFPLVAWVVLFFAWR
jgi:hypothetical protein